MKSLITLFCLLLFGFVATGQSSFLHHEYQKVATPNMGEKIEFIDFDNDGYKELFNYVGNGNARIYNASINGIDSLDYTDIQIPNNYIVTDWNNDGLPDIVFHNSSIQWIENIANFAFAPPAVLSSSNLFTIKSADINSDSYIDIYSYTNNTIKFLINQSGTNSTTEISITVPYNIDIYDADIQFNDIENDGIQEMFVKAKSNKIYIYAQTGSLDYTLQDSIVSNAIGPLESKTMHFQDLNNDGREEIITKNGTFLNVFEWSSGYNYNLVYSGNIDYQLQTGSGNPAALEFSEFYDVDQNGFLDILVGNSIFFNNGSFSFNNVAINTTNQIYLGSHKCHDIDNSGITDVCYVATAGNSYSEIGFFRRENTTAQTLDSKSTVWYFWEDAFSDGVTVDYENDGDIDYVDYTPGKTILWENINDSLFPRKLGGGLPYSTYELNTVNINQDSLPDFLWSSENNFTAQHGYLINSGSNGIFSNIKMDLKLVADIDGDGIDELFFHNRNSGGSGSSDKILMYKLNSGAPVFTSTVLQWSQAGVSDVIIKLADYDLDGLKDVIIQHEASGYNKIRLAHNNGSNSFSWGQVFSMDCKELVGVFDSNGDLFPDIHWLNYNNKIYRHINNGGVFEPHQVFYTLPWGTFPGAKGFSTDFDNDLLTDLIIQSDTRQWQLKNTGAGLQLIHTEPATNRITRIEDMDKDGDDDYVAGDTWYENIHNSPTATKGSVYYDMNSNGNFDLGTDLLFPTFPIELNNNWITTYTDNSGNFNITLGSDSTYNLSIGAAFTNYFTATTTPYPGVANVNTSNPVDSVSIGVTNINSNVDDLFDTYLAGSRCNEEGRLFLHTQNISPEVVDLEIKIIVPPNTSFSSSNQASTQVGDTIIWQITGVNPFEATQFYADFNLPGTAFMMDTMNFYPSAKFTGNLSTRLLTDSLSQILTCAYDPNDKNITMTDFVYNGDSTYSFTDETEYIIRFQNTGNDTARNVMIRDILSDLFDWSTVRPISASHSYNFTIDQYGVIKVDFDNINLPDSSTNFLGSMGYIKFKVDYDSTSPTFVPVKNHALIYFDQNPPIVTNSHKFYRVNCIDFVNLANQASNFCFVDTISVSNNDYGMPFKYEWTIGAYTDFTEDIGLIPFDTAGYQSFTMRISGFGCSFDTTIFMNVKPIPLVTISIGDTSVCQGDLINMTSNRPAYWHEDGVIASYLSSSFYIHAGYTSVIRASVNENGCIGKDEIIIDVANAPPYFHSLNNSELHPGYNPICFDDTVELNTNYDSIICHIDYLTGSQTDYYDTSSAALIIPIDSAETGLMIASQLSHLGCIFSNNVYIKLLSPASYTLQANNGYLPIQAKTTNYYCDESNILVDLDLSVDWYYNGNFINNGIYFDATQSGIYSWVDTCGFTSWFEIENNTSTFTSNNVSICEGDDFTAPDGSVFTNVTSPFSQNSTLINQYGCDSIVTSNINILNTVYENEVVEICKQYTWIDGITYTQSTNAPTYTLSGAQGCDSIVTLDLTIKPPLHETEVVKTCLEFTWIDGITYTQSTNTPTITLTSVEGCDSIVTLDLTIKPQPDLTLSIIDTLLFVYDQATSYQWLNCGDNYSPVLGATDRQFIPSNGGSYAVEINLDGCIDTSECITIDFVDIPNYYKNKLSLNPNPADEKIFISGLNEIPNIRSIQIISITGQLVSELDGKNPDINIRNLSKGEYFVHIIHKKGIETLKFIKK